MASFNASLIDKFSCLRKYLYGLNLTETILNQDRENFCQFHVTIYDYLNVIFLHINPILLIILIIISLYGRIKENYKWLIIHSSLLNFFIIALFIYAYWRPTNTKKFDKPIAEFKKVSNILVYIVMLAGASMLPLAMNRFCFLYFQKFYQRVFTKCGIFLFILFYDIFFCLLYFIAGIWGLSFINALTKFTVMLLEMILSILLIRKIQGMQKQAYTSTFKTRLVVSISDLYRVSILCTLQALFYIIFLFLAFLADIFYNFRYINLYLSLFIYLGALYQIMISLDSLLLLILLKSYRLALVGFVKKIFEEFCGLFESPYNNKDTVSVLLSNQMVTVV